MQKRIFDLNAGFEQKIDQLDVLILDGSNQRWSLEWVGAVDIEFFGFVFKFFQELSDGRAVTTFRSQKKSLFYGFLKQFLKKSFEIIVTKLTGGS